MLHDVFLCKKGACSKPSIAGAAFKMMINKGWHTSGSFYIFEHRRLQPDNRTDVSIVLNLMQNYENRT